MTAHPGRNSEASEPDVFHGVLEMADVFTRALTDALAPFRLTLNQYNVLRTLRHSASKGLTCGEVSDRLSTRDPDITRLLDRLERLGSA
jgi:DNA-binding MarR family transcriptional regulator